MESEAVLLILDRAERGEFELVGSDALSYEIRRIPDPIRRRRVEMLYGDVKLNISVEDTVAKRADVIQRIGIWGLDAVHIACAERADADAMLTTDDRLIKIYTRMTKQIGVPVLNPLQFLMQEALS
jgi:hypothetical protein